MATREPRSPATSEQMLETFATAVEQSRHNLVSSRAAGEIWTRHIPECLALAEMLPSGPTTLLDVGSGGGFPGLVIAASRPDLEVTLLEATRKKVEFLRETAAGMGLSVEVVHDRAETARERLGGRFGIVTARAVAPLARLVGWTVPFLTRDGVVYAVKGDRWRAELDAAADSLRQHDAHIVATPEDILGHDTTASAQLPKVVIIGRAS